MQIDKYGNFQWNEQGFWLGGLKVEDLDGLLELIQIPKAYIKRCIDEGFMDLVCFNVSNWLMLGPELEGEVVEDTIIKLSSAEYKSLNLEELVDWYPLERLDMKTDAFIWSDSVSPYAAGYSVTYLNPSLRVDSAIVCPKTGAIWLWPLNRVVKTRNESHLSIAMAMQDIAAEAWSLAKAKLNYFDRRYEQDIDIESFIRSLCDSLRFNRRQYGSLLGQAQAVAHSELTVAHKLLLGLDEFTVKQRRDISIALSKHVTDGVFK